MGIEASFQAIPEDCELLKRARQEPEVAEWLNIRLKNLIIFNPKFPNVTPAQLYIASAVRELIDLHPGIDERYVSAPGRHWDMIVYLLSQDRRIGNHETDQSLIRKAIWGSEPFYPEARVIIGFVPTVDVNEIAEFLLTVSYSKLKEHYHPPLMRDAKVYKIHPTADDLTFDSIWAEFLTIRDIYQDVAMHGEAMITVID